ncbi:hypothetical protein ACFQX9_30075 [Bradyrhizobium sp. GCM10028915]|uniref:hypothetical protein n=1 Tax=Bradyrhizobium sp. GCM10028915 TaxID=3273385 RepID=UPI00360749C1
MANRPANRTFKKKEVLKAITIPESTFEHWADRKLFGLAPDDFPGDGRGKPRRFGMRTLVKLAIAYRASLTGIPANLAVSLAEKFTDTPQHGRPLGQPFPIGTTWIVLSPSRKASVVNVKPEEDASALLEEATIVINVNRIISAINFDIGIIK